MSENNTSGGNSGISLPMSVISIIRHAITRFIAIARLSRPAVLCARASIPHPDFSTRCQSSMRQRRQYHSMHFSASFGNFISIIFTKNHYTGFVRAGGFSSFTWIIQRDIGDISLKYGGGFNSVRIYRTVTSAIRAARLLRAL